MKRYYTKQSKCERFGHDYAIQDLGNWMVKICLRCGEQVFFFPMDEELEEDEKDE